jgi:hypothetical protein
MTHGGVTLFERAAALTEEVRTVLLRLCAYARSLG